MTINAHYPIAPMRESAKDVERRRIDKSLAMFATARDIATAAGLRLSLHGYRQYEVADPATGATFWAYPAEQRVTPDTLGRLRNDGRDWSIVDVVRACVAAKAGAR